jgi:hypothetical protein
MSLQPSRVEVARTNAYWEAVRGHIDPTGSLWRTPSVGGYGLYRDHLGRLDVERWHHEGPKRSELVERYSWTITDPTTVDFVARHVERVVDPMAGTGWWAKVLTEAGVDMLAYDAAPPASQENTWHKTGVEHFAVMAGDAVQTVTVHSDRTLLLSWPPYGFDACPILDAYAGDRVVYIGEFEGGCCGDDGLFEALSRDWVAVGERVPVQWDGMHDVVRVYDRKCGEPR